MTIRLFALVDESEGTPTSRHFKGWPPELTGGADFRERLPIPRAVLIDEDPIGFFLYRFARDGSLVGDTWHKTLEEAKEQAKDEYGDGLNEWQAILEDVEDADEFVIAQIS